MERISDKHVRGLAAPARGRRIIFDDKINGFGIQVLAASKRHPEGVRTLLLDYRAAGVQRRLSIGRFPAWSTEAARRRAKELRQEIDTGADPMAARHELRNAPTVADLAQRYCAEWLPNRAKASQVRDRAMLAKDILPALGRRRVADVHQGDVLALHQRITARKAPVRANRTLALLSTLFNFAMTPRAGEAEPWRAVGLGNPAKGVAKNPEEGRERFFSEAEINRIAAALNEWPGSKHVANMLRLLMLTGCRPAEAVKMTWSQIDFETGIWSKPGSSTKQRKIHRVPLAPAALELLQRACQVAPDDCPFVFPGRRLQGTWRLICHYDPAWAWVRDRARLGPDAQGRPARAYDLRHSFASVGAAQGLSLLILGKLLGHVQAATTQRYAHLADDPLRQAAEKIGGAIANAGKSSKNVVPLKGGRGA